MRMQIVEEVRRIRQEYAEQFGYDLRALAADLKKHEQQHPQRLITFSPKLAGKEKTAYKIRDIPYYHQGVH
jgi:hypothetical protein